MKKLNTLLIVMLIITMLSGIAVYGYTHIVSKEQAYFTLNESVLYPKNVKGKLPTVFLAHNGGADKSAWGDFPKELADAGFFVVNITWQTWDTSNIDAAINYTLEKYKSKIDTNRVAFVGGCHGAKELLTIMSRDELKYKVKTTVAIGVSENEQAFQEELKKSHPPILAVYSKQDELGEYYQDITKKVAEESITEPKKVVALDETAHGNDILTKSPNRAEYRKQIIDWLKNHLVKCSVRP